VDDPPDLTGVPAGLRELVIACLARDPAARPSLGQVVELLDADTDILDAAEWLPQPVTGLIEQVSGASRHLGPGVPFAAAHEGRAPAMSPGRLSSSPQQAEQPSPTVQASPPRHNRRGNGAR